MKNKKKRLIFFAFMLFMSLHFLGPMKIQAAPKLSTTKKTLEVGQTTTLKVKGTSKKVKWSSSDSWVASVNQSGKVTAKDTGAATITAKVEKKKLKCKVTVKHPEIKMEERKIYSDKNISITLTGITGNEFGYDINVTVENFTTRNLEIYDSEMYINGNKVEPTCYIELPKLGTIDDRITIESSDAKRFPIKNIEDIEVKFRVCDERDDDFSYYTKYIAIMGDLTRPQEEEEEVLGFEKEEARKCLSVSTYAVQNGAIAIIKSTYGANIELGVNFAFYDSAGKLIDTQKEEYVQVAKGIQTIAHVESDAKNVSGVSAVVSDIGKGSPYNHPESVTLTNKNGSKNGVSAQVNNTASEDIESARLTCIFLKNNVPAGYSVEYVGGIGKNSHSFVTFDVPKYEKYVRDEYGDYEWDYVPIDFNQYAIYVDYAYYDYE